MQSRRLIVGICIGILAASFFVVAVHYHDSAGSHGAPATPLPVHGRTFVLKRGPVVGELDVRYTAGPISHSPYYELYLSHSGAWEARYLLSGGPEFAQATIEPIASADYNYPAIARIDAIDRLRLPTGVHGLLKVCGVESKNGCATIRYS
jgi:hypothetical protein